jgi:hypothetical protein
VNLKLISCEVFARQAYYAAAYSPHVVDIELVAKGLHDEPDVLRDEIQSRLDALPEGDYDAILLGYGLCSNSIAGVTCPHTRMVVPRAHDCITVYLGAKELYAEQFREHPGTYWYSPDYMERGGSYDDRKSLGSGDDQKVAKTYEEYVAKFGKDNADYLMEVMGAWREHYDRAAYIDTQEMQLPDYSGEVRELAARRGWRFERLAGSLILLRDLLEGNWDDDRFLTLEPGQTIAPSYDATIVKSATPKLSVEG